MQMDFSRFSQWCILTGIIVYLIFVIRFQDHYKPGLNVLLRSTSSRLRIPGRPHIRGMLCTLLKNEAKYVREWISFHLLLGVDLFIIYDDNSTDNLLKEVHIFQELVTVIPWGFPSNGVDLGTHVQSNR